MLSQAMTLVNLFERIQLFLERLRNLNWISLTAEIRESLGKTLAQVLSILALSKGNVPEPIQ
jgi:hypothetical protein